MTNDEIIGATLKELRKKKGLTMQQVGDKLGTTRYQICHQEAGRRSVSATDFLYLLDLYEVDDPTRLVRELGRKMK